MHLYYGVYLCNWVRTQMNKYTELAKVGKHGEHVGKNK
jgi:hypothetical protein